MYLFLFGWFLFMYTKVRIGKHLSDKFLYPEWFKTRRCFVFSTEYAIRKAQENQVGLSHQLLVYADDVNLLGDNIGTIKKNTQTLTDASK
jgi:hypothetical protein